MEVAAKVGREIVFSPSTIKKLYLCIFFCYQKNYEKINYTQNHTTARSSMRALCAVYGIAAGSMVAATNGADHSTIRERCADAGSK
jgi:hypothetical protein